MKEVTLLILLLLFLSTSILALKPARKYMFYKDPKTGNCYMDCTKPGTNCYV